MKGYPLDKVYEEVAFIAYNLKWGYEELMEMDHSERRRWCEEISRINRALNESSKRE